jgi:hypothetical protein
MSHSYSAASLVRVKVMLNLRTKCRESVVLDKLSPSIFEKRLLLLEPYIKSTPVAPSKFHVLVRVYLLKGKPLFSMLFDRSRDPNAKTQGKNR